MPVVKMVDFNGQEAGELTLSDTVFDAPLHVPAMHQVVVAHLANKRQGTHFTKTRGDVSGGGKKPWKQKHTGRARQGSTTSPQWTGGGVVFAPKPRDFSSKVNKQQKRGALLSALSEKVRADEFMVLDELKLAEIKTKQVAEVLKNLKISSSVLLVTAEADENIVRAARNIPEVTTIPSALINVYDIVAHSKCLVLADAVKKIEEAYGE